jgi:hypothetical protein
MCLTAIIPEYTVAVATMDYLRARKDVASANVLLEAEGLKKWTLTHGLFAQMGGFLLKIPLTEEPGVTVSTYRPKTVAGGSFNSAEANHENTLESRSVRHLEPLSEKRRPTIDQQYKGEFLTLKMLSK